LKNWKQKDRILLLRKDQFQVPYSTRNFPISGTGFLHSSKKVLTTLSSPRYPSFAVFPSITDRKRWLPFLILVKSQFSGKHVPLLEFFPLYFKTAK
jgi:hypothetical protein